MHDLPKDLSNFKRLYNFGEIVQGSEEKYLDIEPQARRSFISFGPKSKPNETSPTWKTMSIPRDNPTL